MGLSVHVRASSSRGRSSTKISSQTELGAECTCLATSPLRFAGFSRKAVKWRMRLFSRKKSKKRGSFWSPHIMSSAMALNASTTLPLFWSVTSELLRNTSCRCRNSSMEYLSLGAGKPNRLPQNPTCFFDVISSQSSHPSYGK